MSGMFKYALNDGDNVAGKKNADFIPQILLTGVGIANKQCDINFNGDERRTMLVPNADDPIKFSVKVNGERVEEPVRLEHGDRILIGSHHYYLFVDPLVNSDEQVEWETAMKEANKDSMGLAGNDEEEYNK